MRVPPPSTDRSPRHIHPDERRDHGKTRRNHRKPRHGRALPLARDVRRDRRSVDPCGVLDTARRRCPRDARPPRSRRAFRSPRGRADRPCGGRDDRARSRRARNAPRGIPHCWKATGAEELHFVVEVTPAGNFEAGIETIFQMARDGKVRDNGVPRLLAFAAHHRMLLRDAYPVSPPRWVLRLVLGALEPFARWRIAT